MDENNMQTPSTT